MTKKGVKEIKDAFNNLSLEEQAKWEKKAQEINEKGLGAYISTVGHLLDEGILVFKNNKIIICGKYAAKMHQEQGISLKIWVETINDKLNKLKP